MLLRAFLRGTRHRGVRAHGPSLCPQIRAVPRPLLSLHSSATIVTCRPPSAAGGPISRRSSSSLAHLLVGCYTADHEALAYYTNTAEDGGAYVVGLDTSDGSLTVLDGPVEAGTNPTYAATNGSAAFFTNENLEDGYVYAFQLSADGKLTPLNNQPVAGDGACHPCYLAVAPGTGEVLSASYVSAHVHAFPVHDDGCLGPGRTTKLPPAAPEVTYPGPVAERQEGPHAHCYEPMGDGTFGLVCDLGSDELLVLRTSDGSLVSRAAFPAGSGPRHVAITADLSRVYVSTELSNTLQTVPIDATTGKLGTPIGASLLPTDYTGPPTTASHIELSPCGGFAYVANRVGVDKDGGCSAAAEGSISVLKVGSEAAELVEVVEIGGKVPRGFCVVSAGAQGGGWLVVGAQESSILRTFAVQPSSGRLKRTEHELAIPSPGCVVAV